MGLTVLFACAKRLGMAFKFGFKFPVGGSVQVKSFISPWFHYVTALIEIAVYALYIRAERNVADISLTTKQNSHTWICRM